MARLEPWAQFEADVQDRWSLDSTGSSGNQFHDSGDAVDNRADSPWPMWVECKYRTAKSFSIRAGEIRSWHERAQLLGKRFVLALRFHDPIKNPRLSDDYVILPRDDYEELLVKAKIL